ncbi:MAG: response regulator [Myxococcales bacterium]|nr:response regulator [Myxococcales bacterium]
MSDTDELLAVFQAEVGRQIGELQQLLGEDPDRWESARLFSLSHNVKGASRIVGFPILGTVAHGLEELFTMLDGEVAIDDEFAALAREGCALLGTCFEALGRPEFEGPAKKYRADAVAYLAKREGGDTGTGGATGGAPKPEDGGGGEPQERGASPADPENRGRPAPPRAPPPGPRSAPPSESPQAGAAGASSATRGGGSGDTIRIAVGKIDAVTDLGAELIALGRSGETHRELAAQLIRQLAHLRREVADIARRDTFRRLEQLSRTLHRHLTQDAGRGHRLHTQLEQAVRMLRMVRLDAIRSLLQRVLEGACEEKSREAELVIDGGATELDRVVLDALRDPLVHLIRNAVAHGLEPRDRRLAAGKDPVGRVSLQASSSGSWLDVVIRDDGAGMDHERIARRAVEQGLLSEPEAERASRQELLELVFRPGFSTEQEVSPLSGRGVGMDVARANLLDLGGSVSISSTPGVGTEVRLHAPLTRLTARGIVVRVGDQLLAVPIVGIERTVVIERAQVQLADGEEMIRVGDGLVPVGAMGVALGLTDDQADERPALILSTGSRRRAMIVDDVLGEREFTIQPLPWHIERLKGLSGAAVLEGGEIALVVSVSELVQPQTSRASGQMPSARRHRQRRILVVDDSITSRTLEKNILSAAGYDVQTAVNGALALEVLRDGGIDLVVSDVDMPEKNGFELTRAIRASSELAQLPVILVTSLGEDADLQRGAEAGANAHIVKGAFDQDMLLSTVARLL